jgi:hypothetical protein
VEISCLKCGAPLTPDTQNPTPAQAADAEKDGRALSIANRKSNDTLNGEEEVREVLLDVTSVDKVMETSRGSQRSESPAMLAIPALIVVTGAMVLFQFRSDAWSEYTLHYEFGRNILLVGIWLLLVLEAWRDSLGKGALSLLFPPYVMLYALRESESGLLRGAIFGMFLGLCTEAFLIPDAAILQSLGPAAQGMVDQVDSWIALASKEPVNSEMR